MNSRFTTTRLVQSILWKAFCRSSQWNWKMGGRNTNWTNKWRKSLLEQVERSKREGCQILINLSKPIFVVILTHFFPSFLLFFKFDTKESISKLFLQTFILYFFPLGSFSKMMYHCIRWYLFSEMGIYYSRLSHFIQDFLLLKFKLNS